MANKIGLIICQNFQLEMEAIIRSEGFEDVEWTTYFAHCGQKGLTWEAFEQIIEIRLNDCRSISIIGCHCLDNLPAPGQNPRKIRIHKAAECSNLLTNQGLVDGLIHKGAFLLVPGWLRQWKYHLGMWGLTPRSSRLLFSDSPAGLLLLDTGLDKRSHSLLKEVAEYVSLPCHSLPVGLDFFRLFLRNIVLEGHLENSRILTGEALSGPGLPLADFYLLSDLIGHLTRAQLEAEAIETLLDFSAQLFAAAKLVYLSVIQGRPKKIFFWPPTLECNEKGERDRLLTLGQEFVWSDSQKGFRLRVTHQEETLGILEVEGLADSGGQEYVLKFALNIAKFFGLVISNLRTHQLLRRERDASQEYLDVGRVIFVIINSDQKVILVNKKGCEILDYSEEEIVGKNWFDSFVPERIRKQLKENFANWVAGEVGALEYYETPVLTKNGAEKLIAWNNTILQDDAGRIVATLCSGEDITERKRTEEELQILSLVDDLTGLYNRRGFMTLAEQQLKIADRMQKKMLLLFFDLDDMKRINDTYGHLEGDRALKETAEVLRETFRESDIIGRLGGDEFSVLALESDEATSEILTKRMAGIVERHYKDRNSPYRLSLSLGVAYYDPSDPHALETLLVQADHAMYAQKKAKKSKPKEKQLYLVLNNEEEIN